MTIAYLNTEYPSLSHTFIEREIRALRARRVDIQPLSVRPAPKARTIGEANAVAAVETIVIQAGAMRTATRAAIACALHPIQALRAFTKGQRMSPGGCAARVRHFAYALHAMILLGHLKRLGIRHVHVHMANNGAAIALLAATASANVTYSLSVHGSAEFFHVDSWTLTEKVEGAQFVRCISKFCRAQVMAWSKPEVWPRFSVVRCGVDPAAYAEKPVDPDHPLRIITVGRLHPIKGYELLLDACAQLLKKGRGIEVHMIGDGPTRQSLEQAIVRLGLTETVKLMGPVPQEHVRQHLDRAHVMVVSSFMEGVPVVLMEAMASGLGIVATAVGGVPELVEHGVSGFVVPPGCADAIAGAIDRYATDRSLCARHGAAGRKKVIEHYSIEQTAQGMFELFCRNGVVPDSMEWAQSDEAVLSV